MKTHTCTWHQNNTIYVLGSLWIQDSLQHIYFKWMYIKIEFSSSSTRRSCKVLFLRGTVWESKTYVSHCVKHRWIREIKFFIRGWNTGVCSAYENTGVYRYASYVNVNKSRIPLYSIYLGKYCAVFRILGMKYLI